MINKLRGAGLKGLKLCFIATFLPLMIRKRKDLFSGDFRKTLALLKKSTIAYLRAAAFIMLGNSVPIILLCQLPYNAKLIKNWSLVLKYTLIYVNLAMCSLLVEDAARMPAYLGFVLSKAIGLMWAMIKFRMQGNIKEMIAFETVIKWAILAGLIGFVSVKQA